jgi:hypothetical protein
MAGFDAIRDVSNTLRLLLDDALQAVDAVAPPRAELHDLSPPPSGNPAVLTLFLYEICEDTVLRNRPDVRTLIDHEYQTKRAPLPLVLRYLVTAWGGDRATEQAMLGRTLQVLYDGQIIRPHQLQGRLAASPDGLSITLAPLTLEERTRVWWSIQRPYRLSINYEVRVVDIDAEDVDTSAPVGRRILEFSDVGATTP